MVDKLVSYICRKKGKESIFINTSSYILYDYRFYMTFSHIIGNAFFLIKKSNKCNKYFTI